MHRTEAALIARGLDKKLAQALRAQGMTLAKLRKLNDKNLRSHGLSIDQIALIRSKRPPIPTKTLIQLFVKSRWTCCVCRDRSLSIIAHHIKPWSDSHDHSENNLAVLCLTHHGEAHTKHELGLNLTAERIRQMKNKWEKYVVEEDIKAMAYQPIFEDIQWLYFNHQRMFALADELGTDFRAMNSYAECLTLDLITKSGIPQVGASDTKWMYQGANGNTLYRYCKSVMEAIWHSSKIVDLSDHFDRDEVPARARSSFIYVQGAHVFAKKRGASVGQATTGKRSANRVETTFTFDRGEATSCSAWSEWLSGRKNVGCVLRVHNITSSEAKTRIQATVIAICLPIPHLATRRYDERLWASGLPFKHEEEE